MFLQTGTNFPLTTTLINDPISDFTYKMCDPLVTVSGIFTSLTNSGCASSTYYTETLTVTYSTALSGGGTNTATPSWITWTAPYNKPLTV